MEIVLGAFLVYFCRDRAFAGLIPVPWLGWVALAFGVVLLLFPHAIKFEG